jgi:hypothetical protein
MSIDEAMSGAMGYQLASKSSGLVTIVGQGASWFYKWHCSSKRTGNDRLTGRFSCHASRANMGEKGTARMKFVISPGMWAKIQKGVRCDSSGLGDTSSSVENLTGTLNLSCDTAERIVNDTLVDDPPLKGNSDLGKYSCPHDQWPQDDGSVIDHYECRILTARHFADRLFLWEQVPDQYY